MGILRRKAASPIVDNNRCLIIIYPVVSLFVAHDIAEQMINLKIALDLVRILEGGDIRTR